jgi:putative Holliday junction resolvase
MRNAECVPNLKSKTLKPLPTLNLDPVSDNSNGESLPSEGRLAGIDFGTVRIGVSISDPSQTIATPLEVLNRRTLELDRQYFVNLVQVEQLVGFIVGLPVHMSGDASAKSKQAVEFGQWLSEVTSLPVDYIDERYTTSIAREMLNQTNLSGKKRKAMLDKLAAQVILTAYLGQ